MSVSIAVPSKSKEPLASSSGKSTWGPAVFAWGIWGLLIVTGLLLIVKYHHSIPISPGDDWGRYLMCIAGTRPMTVHELWQPEYEHRLLLITVVGVALLKASAGDYWSMALFYVLCMGVLSAGFLLAARRVRGRASYTDAVLPLGVFVGMFTEMLFYGNWLTYFAEAWVPGGIFVIMVRQGTRLTLGWGVLAALLLLILPSGIGAGGPLYFPVLFLWLVYSVFSSWRARVLSGGRCLVILALAALGLVIFGLYFYHLGLGSHPVAHPDFRTMIATTLAWFTASLGPAAGNLWPFAGAPMALVLLLTAVILAVTLWRGGSEARSRALGLTFYLAAIGMFGLGFSWGRAGGGGPGSAFWYWPLATTVLPWFYFTWELCLPRAASQFAQMCFLTVVGALVTLDMEAGIGGIKNSYETAHTVEAAVRDGAPPYVLQGRYSGVLGTFNSEVALQLHRAGFGIYKYMGEDPPFRGLEPLPLASAVVHRATWDGTTAQGMEPGAYVAFPLAEPTFVAYIDIQCSVNANTRISWGRTENGQFVETGSWAPLPYFSDQDGAIFVADTIDQIRIALDTSAVRVSRIVPAVPDPGQ